MGQNMPISRKTCRSVTWSDSTLQFDQGNVITAAWTQHENEIYCTSYSRYASLLFVKRLLAPVLDSEGIPAPVDNDLSSGDGHRSVLLLLQVMFSQIHPVSSATAAGPQEEDKAVQKHSQILSNGK